MGNLLTEESSRKITKYAYNSQSRLIYCEVTDNLEKEYSQSTYAYDAFGRRILVQDKGEAALRTLYDGLTFDVIKQSPTMANGMFTDSFDTGIHYSRTGRPTGDRYRYISDEDVYDNSRYRYINENTFKIANGRYRGERTQISVNGSIAAQATSEGTQYFSTDLLGSVVSVTDNYGNQNSSYSYDAFGSLVQGDLSGSTDFGFLSKQSDATAKLYNYGYRDYKPQLARFTTVDPIRDGSNWFTYVRNDPINAIDILGLCEANDIRYTENIIQYPIPDDNGARYLKTRSITTGIVIHYTAGAYKGKDGLEHAQTPKETIDYWIGAESTNAHFVIGDNGEIYQAIPKDEIGQHAGNGGPYKINEEIQEKLGGHPNARTVGIEMENIDTNGNFTQETITATVQLTAELCVEYDLDPQKDLYRHYDITGKPCPKKFVDDPSAWQDFKDLVEIEVNKIKNNINE